MLVALLFAGVALVASGCLGETTCRELGCADDERCNMQTGECEPLDRDCEPGSCPTGEVCDPASGQCQPELPSCEDQSCPEGLQCNVETRRCEVNPGCTPDSCTSPAQRCNPASDRCEPIDCSRDSDCPTGYICSSDDECLAGCRGGSTRCPPNRFCSSDSPGEIGQCLPECRSNQSCPHGQVCTTEDGLRSCRPEGPCQLDADCRDDEVCINQRCVAPPCTSDEDCPEALTCYESTGGCVGGNCQDDPFSPNHRPDSAAELQTNIYTGLTLCPARDDWYTFAADSSQALSFQLQYASETDLDLYVYDADGRLIGQNRRPAPGSIPTTDRIELISTRDQQLTIRVSAHPNTPDPDSVTYSLGLEPDDARFCRDDVEEENDTLSEATQLTGTVGVPTDVSFQICGPDQDVFELGDVASDNGLRVSLRDAAPHLRLDVMPDGASNATLTPGDQLRWLRVGNAARWVFRVSSRFNRSSGYNYRFQVTSPWDCPNVQQYTSPADAKPVARSNPDELIFCPLESGWEVDWASLQSPTTANSLLQAVVTPKPSMPEITVALFRRPAGGDPKFVRNAVSTPNGLVLAAPFAPTETPLIRVSSSTTPSTILEEPAYELSYSYDAP